MPTQSPAAPSIEDWETPATQKNHEQRDPVSDLVDPLLMATNALHDGNSAPNHRPQTSVYPLEGLEEAAMQDADEWLQSMANNDDNEWPFVPQADEASPITSVATDTRTARGIIFKGCRCTSHQDTYSDWPVQDAELTIAKCMRVCVYCGKDFETAAALRGHMRRIYARRNLTISPDNKGRWSTASPGWTRRHRTESPPRQPAARLTSSHSITYSTNAMSQPC